MRNPSFRGRGRLCFRGSFSNVGNRALRVPGYDLPIALDIPHDQSFQGALDSGGPPEIETKELALLELIAALTDKPNWHLDVYRADIRRKWRQETLASPLVDDASWKWCFAELQDKSRHFEATRRCIVLNAGAGICKADSSFPEYTCVKLRNLVQQLLDATRSEKDWHPDPDSQVLRLVDPSMFPLFYGRTKVLTDGTVVGLENILESCGKGTETSSQLDLFKPHWLDLESDIQTTPYPIDNFSPNFQCLPCEVEFSGETGTTVKITSYINNLHPGRWKQLYEVVEQVISGAIEPWNEVLLQNYEHHYPRLARIVKDDLILEAEHWETLPWVKDKTKLKDPKTRASAIKYIKDYLTLPEPVEAEWHHHWTTPHPVPTDWENDVNLFEEALSAKWQRRPGWLNKRAIRPLTYEKWKTKAVLKGPGEDDSLLVPETGHRYQDVALQKTFRTKGLQVIVKFSNIELTPDKPTYRADKWCINNIGNEHIAAVATYYYSVSNVADPRLSFQTEFQPHHRREYEEPEILPFMTDELGRVVQPYRIRSHYDDEPHHQRIGSVSIQEDRLIAWPSRLQYRIDDFELMDKRRPGHIRSVTLCLVDPNYRICSTRNVPPQRHHWLVEEGISKFDWKEKGIPQEIVDMIGEEVARGAMKMDEAKSLRNEFMYEFAPDLQSQEDKDRL